MPANTRGRALLVEDEFLVSLDIQALLEHAGFEVVGPIARAQEAIHIARTEPDLLLGVLDVNLAGEQSWPVARTLRRRGIHFLFVTGYIQAHTQLPGDFCDSIVLPKPLNAEHLAQAIERLFA